MSPCYLWRNVILLFLPIVVSAPSLAGEPTEQLRETTDKIVAIVTDPELKRAEKAGEKKRLIREAVNQRFDWEEMTRRALARHWARRTDEEKKEFIYLFGKLLERTYLDRVDDYSGERAHFETETVDGNFGVVTAKILTRQEKEISVLYKVKKKGRKWYVYDVSIEGVSLINNYRTQFNSIITRSSYKDLIRRLKARVGEN
jgi:phospholipid transport system substrate-binding protein